jgi:hypothetical protein
MRKLLLALAACSHAPTAATVPDSPAPATTHAMPEVGPNTMGWTTWPHDKKLAYMKDTVSPAEKQIFATFEPVRYAYLTCETCHGQSARQRNYRMPNPDLPHLVGGKEGFMELAAKQPETLRFMQQVVAPETAKLLGYQVFDMDKHIGFSCYQCHVRADVKD